MPLHAQLDGLKNSAKMFFLEAKSVSIFLECRWGKFKVTLIAKYTTNLIHSTGISTEQLAC